MVVALYVSARAVMVRAPVSMRITARPKRCFLNNGFLNNDFIKEHSFLGQLENALLPDKCRLEYKQ
jgi:hypothetical protein